MHISKLNPWRCGSFEAFIVIAALQSSILSLPSTDGAAIHLRYAGPVEADVLANWYFGVTYAQLNQLG